MKKFYFKDELLKINKTYGGSKRQCTIYQLKKGDIEKLGNLEYNTASTMGNISEVNQWLYENKYITKNDIKKQSGKEEVSKYNNYYFMKYNEPNHYIIKEI